MDKSLKYGITGLLLIGVMAAVYFMNDTNQNEVRAKKDNHVEVINWKKTYDSQSNHPYGTYFLKELMEFGFDGYYLKTMDHSVQAYFAHDSLQIKGDQPINYMFIGEELRLYNDEVDSLLRFIGDGNNAFIASEYYPHRLLATLFSSSGNGYLREESDTSIQLFFNEEPFNGVNYRLENRVDYKNLEKRWKVWNYSIYSPYNKTEIGQAGYSSCYIKLKYGLGTILIHTVPQAFTNEFLKSQDGRLYVESALSYLPEGTVLWDDFSAYVTDNGNLEMDYDKNRNSRRGKRSSESSIKHLMTTPSLRWGYLLMLFGMVTFVVFMGKRRQKIIPTVQKNINSSVEFTETVSRIYLSKNRHSKLIKHMETIFINKMKNKYYVAYSDDNNYITKISKKSGVPEEEIKHIFKLFKAGRAVGEISDMYLIDLYKRLDEFYNKAK